MAAVGRGLRTVANGLDHPEGVCWSPAEGAVYAGGEAGQLYRFALGGGEPETVTTVPGGFLLGMALDARGNVYACDANSGHVQRISADGRIESHGDRIGYPNYPVFDRDGNLWVTDSGAWDHVSGGLVRIAPDGVTERIAGPFRFANGLAMSWLIWTRCRRDWPLRWIGRSSRIWRPMLICGSARNLTDDIREPPATSGTGTCSSQGIGKGASPRRFSDRL